MKSEDITATQNIISRFNSIVMCLYLSNIFIQELYKLSSDNKNIIAKAFVEYFKNYQPDKLDKIK